jgi:CheY-like chemotaxis protein
MTVETERQSPLVVVIDDDRDTRELYRIVLESVGYRVEDAGTVAAARSAFQGVVPDVVLSDWLLPDGNGGDVCAAAFARGATRHVPIVVLSGLTLTSDAEARARQRGLVKILGKPADPDTILNAISDALIVGTERRVRAAVSRTKRYADQARRRAAQLRTGAVNTAADASALLARAAARSAGSICLMIADDHARYIATGGATREVTGYEPAELLQLTVWDLTPSQKTAASQGLWARFISAGQQEGPYTLRRRDGEAIETRYCALANIAPGWHLSAIAEAPTMPVTLRL